MRTQLIVNADDFGQSAGVNAGIVAAHERGIVTAASLMVRWPAVAEAAAYARAHPALDVGLHLDLGEWAMRAGSWEPLYEIVSLNDAGAVRTEVRRQVDAFHRLVGRDPTHLDSHQHVHVHSRAVRRAATEVADELGAALRGLSGISYRGDFYGQTDEGAPIDGVISADGLAAILATVEPGVTELSCHPGYGCDNRTMYGAAEREREVRVLCHPRVRDVLARRRIELRTFPALAVRR
jgi:chitin disaccharide deacetylase